MTSGNTPEHNVMGLMDHLRELRKRLLFSAIFVTLGGFAAYYYATEIFFVLCAPYYQAFADSPLIGTSPTEAWVLKLKVSIFAGCLLTSPLLFHQLWLFIAPGLYESERRYVIPFVLLSSILFCGGAWFCYDAVLPVTLSFFFNEFASINISPTIKLADHLSMTITLLVAFGLVFELPLLTLFLTRMGVIDHLFLLRYFKHAIVVIFITAAVLTPPDVITQFLMAGPLIVLYVISVAIAYLASPSRTNVEAHQTITEKQLDQTSTTR
jgi:sec-independent protein translocase protein TatC